jgi:hypothetical protein
MSPASPLNKRRRLAITTATATLDDDDDGDAHAAAAADGQQQQQQYPIGSSTNNDGGNNDDDNDASDHLPTDNSLPKSSHHHCNTAVWSARQNLGMRGGVAPTASTSSHVPSSEPIQSSSSAAAVVAALATTAVAPAPRWRTHQIAEDYISLASSIMLPPIHLGPFGYSPTMGRYPIEQTTTLGYLSSPLRRPSVIEKWSPYEIALFEGALAYHGKLFNLISKHYVTAKSTKEIIEFYYIWKKTSHGRRWKIALLEQGGGIGGGGGGGSAGGGLLGSSSGSDCSSEEEEEKEGGDKKKVDGKKEEDCMDIEGSASVLSVNGVGEPSSSNGGGKGSVR